MKNPLKHARLYLAATLVVAALIGASPAAAAKMHACFGAPADYVAAFDTVRGQTKDNQVKYPEPRVYLEVQGWLTPNVDANGDGKMDLPPGHHSEHIHEGACFPEDEPWAEPNDARHLDVKFTFHNVTNYTVTQVGGSFVSQLGSGAGFTASPAQRDELTTAMNHSGSMDAIGLSTAFQSYTATGPTGSDGLRDLRLSILVARTNADALVDTWRVEAHWWSYFDYPGLPTVLGVGGTAPGPNVQTLQEQDWITVKNPDGTTHLAYHKVGFAKSVGPTRWTANGMSRPRGCTWPLNLNGTDGTNQVLAAVDPDFHSHYPPGPDVDAFGNYLGPWHYQTPVHTLRDQWVPISIPLCSLGFPSKSKHKLFVRGDAVPGSVGRQDRPEDSAAIVIPFKAPELP